MTLFQPYPVSSGSVRGAAEQSTNGIPAIQGLEAGVESDHKAALQAVKGDLAPYVGKAREPASRWSKAVVARVSFAGGAMNLFAIAIDDFNTNSSSPRSVSKLNAAYEEAAADNFGVDASEYSKDEAGGPILDARRYSNAVSTAKEALIAELKVEYAKLDEQLDEEAAKVAGMLKGKDPRPEHVQEMYAAGALPSHAALLFPGVDLTKTKLTRLPTDLYGRSPEQIAAHLAKNPGTYNLIAGQLRSLVPGLEEKVGREIANQLRNAKLEGDGSAEALRRYKSLLKAWQETSLGVTAEIYENLGAKDTLGFLTKLNQLTGPVGEDPLALARVFRHGLALADLMWSDEQSERFGRDLGDELKRNLDSWDAMAYLLHNQHYSTALLDPLGDSIARLDTSATSLNTPIPHGVLDGPTNVTEALFSALSKNPEAALNFFADDGEAAQRQKHFLLDRAYPDSKFDSLFAALEAATLDDVNTGDPDRAKLAAGLVSSIAEYIPDRGLDAGDVGEKATVSMAHILSGYMDSVSNALLNPEGAGERGSGQGYLPGADGSVRAVFENAELKALVKLAVSSEDGFNAMRHGVSAYEQLTLHNEIKAHHSLTTAALYNDARIEGFFTDCVGEQKVEQAEDDDQRRAAWIEMGSSLVGMIPLPGADEVGVLGSKAIGYLVDQSMNAGTDGLTKAYAETADAKAAEGAPAADLALENRQLAIAMAMVEMGGDHGQLISHDDLRKAAPGFDDGEFERWFGTKEEPRLPSSAELGAMSQNERDQYETVLKQALMNNSPSFKEGTYQSMYRTQFIEAQAR